MFHMAKRDNEIIGFHLGWDLREVSEGRYQLYTSPSPAEYYWWARSR